jgi:hypothetical protein
LLLIESTWNDTAPHVYGLAVSEWTELMAEAGLTRTHAAGHCFNLARRYAPTWLPARDAVTIALDYPLEFALMRCHRNRLSTIAMQHLMVFTRC